MMDLYGEAMLNRGSAPHMSLDNPIKDVRYYARRLEQASLPGFVAHPVHQMYSLASNKVYGDEGCTEVIKAY